MVTKNAILVKPQRVMTPDARSMIRPTTTSPMVFQKLMESLAQLNHNLQALASRPAAPPAVPNHQKIQNTGEQEKKVDREELRKVFD